MAAPWLNDADMDAIGIALAGGRKDSCVIVVPTAVTGAGGARSFTYADGGIVSCRVARDDRAPVERLADGRLVAEASHTIALPRGTAIGKDHRIRSLRTGEVFEVINDPHEPTFKFELICSCMEVK